MEEGGSRAFPQESEVVETSQDTGRDERAAEWSSGTVCVRSGWGAATGPRNERPLFPTFLILPQIALLSV